MSARWTIGLTGDVGGGKSTVRVWLAERGAATLDADAVAHRVLADDRAVGRAVVAQFGPRVRGADGAIDRAALAAIVFRDPAALAVLEEIVHPPVLARVRAWLADAAAEVAVVEAVKLVESGLDMELDVLWLVTCDARERRARLAARGWPLDEIARRLAAGLPLAPRLARADVVIDNSGTWAATLRQLELAWSRRPQATGAEGDPVRVGMPGA